MNGWIDRLTDGQIDGGIDGQMDQLMDEQTDLWTDRHMGLTDRRTVRRMEEIFILGKISNAKFVQYINFS